MPLTRLTVFDGDVSQCDSVKSKNLNYIEVSNFNSLNEILFQIKNRPNVVDLFAHGHDEKIILGKDTITLQQLGRLLGNTGHINVLGCDVAKSSRGKALIDKIAEYTGLSVAASDDKTGSSTLGGDWTLEYLTSRHADALAQLPKNYHAYSGALYDPATYDSATTDTDSDGLMDAVDIDDDNDGILDSLEKGTCDASANPTYPGDYSAFADFEYTQVDDPSPTVAANDWYIDPLADLVANNPLHYTATYNPHRVCFRYIR